MNFTLIIIRCILSFTVIFSITGSGVRYGYNESDVKAAFIINFTKYIDWENDQFQKDEYFTIGIIEDESVYNSLKMLDSKKIRNKPVKLKFFSNSESIEKCHLLYISDKVKVSRISSLADSDGFRNALLITHKKHALNHGVSINFISAGKTLKFEISQKNLSKNKLKASSYLLNLAVNI